MRALWTKLRDRAGDDRDARFPARMGAAIENIGVMRGAIDVPEGESDMRVIVRVGEERDRQDIGLQFRLPEIADIAADTRQQAIIYPFRSEEHTSELQSLMRISYAVFCLKKKTQ